MRIVDFLIDGLRKGGADRESARDTLIGLGAYVGEVLVRRAGAVYSGSRPALYQNGTLMGTATNLSPQYDSSLPLTIGGCANSASATTPYLAFPGSVADVHVYPRALTTTEVSTLH
ncbi:LamG-like jellyroll fold domain-containing protein [Streptomyces sp. E-15]